MRSQRRASFDFDPASDAARVRRGGHPRVLQTGDTRVLYGAFAVAVIRRSWIVTPIFQRETHWVDAAAIYEPFKLDDPALPPVVVDLLQHIRQSWRLRVLAP